MRHDPTSPDQSAKITKGQRDALRKIERREGTFHSVIGNRLCGAGLAYPISGLFNFIIGCNCRSADGWVLTDAGMEALR